MIIAKQEKELLSDMVSEIMDSAAVGNNCDHDERVEKEVKTTVKKYMKEYKRLVLWDNIQE